ncbi:MAG: MaoC family dehydratase [Candidatus Eremiobacteraeota bacterium]|nr:MaoC family dehydratase [Candidatus Eremiobacteraeota bacterium]
MTSERRTFRDIAEIEAAVGTHVGDSPWVTVTQKMIDDFAAVTHDEQWIHVDVERAKRESPFKTPIAHGFLTLSLLSHLMQSTVRTENVALSVNYGFEKVRFVSPVPVDSEVRASVSVGEVKRTPEGAQVTWNVEIQVRGSDRPAVVAAWLGRIYTARPA